MALQFSHVEIPPASPHLQELIANGQVIILDSRTPSGEDDPSDEWHPADTISEDDTAGITQPVGVHSTLTSKSSGPSIGHLPSFLGNCHPEYCSVLAFFGMFCHDGLIICTLHARPLTIVPLSNLQHHLHSTHKFSVHREIKPAFGVGVDIAKRSRANILQDIVANVARCTSISPLQATDDVTAPVEVDMPIVVPTYLSTETQSIHEDRKRNSTLTQKYKCPSDLCAIWRCVSRSRGSDKQELLRHVGQCCPHLKQIVYKDNYKPRWVQCLTVVCSTNRRKEKQLLLPKDFIPEDGESFQSVPRESQSALMAFSENALMHFEWAGPIQWAEHRTTLGSFSVSTLHKFIARPTSQLVACAVGKACYIEMGLTRLIRIAYGYFCEAHRFLEQAGPSLSYILVAKTVSKYKITNILSLYKLSSILVATIALMLRWELLMDEPTVSLRFIGNFRLARTPVQQAAARDLYTLFLATEGNPPVLQLQKAFHTLCVVLLKPDSASEAIIAYPTEQVLFVESMASNNKWNRASRTYERIAHFHTAFLLILVQMARLHQSGSLCYTPLDKDSEELANGVNEVDFQQAELEEAQDSWLVTEGEAELNHEIPDEDNPSQELDIEDAHSTIWNQVTAAAQFVSDHADYISDTPSTGLSTPFNRMTQLRITVYSSAKNRKQVNISRNRRILTLSCEQANPIAVDLDDWSRAATLATCKLQQAIQAALHPQDSAHTFPSHTLKDSYSRTAVFKQTLNAVWLDPLRHQIRRRLMEHHHLFGPSGIKLQECIKWLDLNQAILQALAVVFFLTSGISPPQYEMRLLFDSTPNELRNIWILPSGLVMWVNPFSRPKDGTSAPAAYCLPPEPTHDMLFYLTIIRPIACEVLQLLGMDTTAYSSILWVHYRRNVNIKELSWSGPQMCSPLVEHMTEVTKLPVRPQDLRIIVNTIMRTYFSGAFEQVQDSIVDKAAQHITLTSLGNYGRVSYFPPLPHIRFNQPGSFIALSQIWHAILGIGPVNESWRSAIQASSLMAPYTSDPSINCGLHHAYHVVQVMLQTYPHSAIDIASHFVQSLSIVYGPQASSTLPLLDLGNKILATTLKMVMADIHHTQVCSSKEHNLEVNDVVYTICLVLRALTESSKTILNYKALGSKARLDYAEIKTKLTSLVNSTISNHIELWHTLEHDVSTR